MNSRRGFFEKRIPRKMERLLIGNRGSFTVYTCRRLRDRRSFVLDERNKKTSGAANEAQKHLRKKPSFFSRRMVDIFAPFPYRAGYSSFLPLFDRITVDQENPINVSPKNP